MVCDGLIKSWIIYKIVTPDNFIYIGKTDNVKRRILNHANTKRQANKFLKESIIRYGWEQHIIIILETFESDDVFAQGKEIFWIRNYMANKNKWPEMKGFNLTDGGDGLLGYRHTVEHKSKIGNANSLKTRNVELKNRISKTLSGRKLPKERIINSAKAHQKPMLIYDLNGNFIKECESSKEVYKYLYGKEGTSGHINEVAKGTRNNYKGYIFKYK